MIKKIFAGVTYVVMVVMNVLANSLPLNNRNTGAVSDSYPNLFAPAGVTFAIWGVIYLLLAGFVVYQFINKDQKIEGLIKKINPWFIGTSLANTVWIFAWHYNYIGISMLITTTILVLLIKIADILGAEQLTTKEKIFISTPFSVYFGWVTVATIANITVFLVSIGFKGFGIADYIWTAVILLVGALIGVLRMLKDKSVAYGLVLVWAYLGILLKHVSAAGFNGQYPSVIVTVIVCLALFGFFIGKVAYKK